MESGKKILTLCIVHQSPRVLLGMKKRGFGAGKWNGFGGKIHEGETIEDAAHRELLEETGIRVKSLEHMGVLDFEFVENPEVLEVHVFKGIGRKGDPKETEEMKPQWFDVDNVPFDRMWPDDRHWMPLFLAGKKFRGRFLFDSSDAILEKYLEEV